MALLNTHPDYMCFDGAQSKDEFPVGLYEEFLSYIREKYEGTYWSANPREVSRFYCASMRRRRVIQERKYACWCITATRRTTG